MILETEYLNQKHLDGFDNYKYSSKDTGILSIYVMHPFWNWVVQYCPKNIAPNLLTFSGFLCTVAMYLMYTILDYNFEASDPDHPDVALVPQWTWFIAAILLFLAYTLDGIDGKQARRTGTSGPLGELFDHGLDSYTAGLLPATIYSIFGRGSRYSVPPFRMFYLMWNVLLNFFLSHFEKYNTGVLFLPWGYDFTMCGMIITFFITGIVGTDFWQYSLPGGITNGLLFELLLYVSALISNHPIVFYNIYKSYRDKTGHMRSFSEAVRPMVPLCILFLVTLLWVYLSPANIVERDPRALYLLLGTIFSNITCRLIVAQMSGTRCDWFNWMILPTILVVVISVSTQWANLEMFFLYSLCVSVTVAHLHYGTCVFEAEFRRFSLERNAQAKFEDFKSLLERLHKLRDLAFLISYIDPSDQDLLPINNDDNLRRALVNAKPLLRVIIQRKGDSLEELNGYGTIKPRTLISTILGGTPARTKTLPISNPHDFRQVSAIIDVDIVPETCRRVRLLKHGSDKPLGFYIRDGTSVKVTQIGLEKIPGVFISRLVPGGLAESTGLLAVNDEVLEVNGIEVAGKTLDQVTDMMIANSSNLIITVKPANQRTVGPVRRGSFGRNSHMSSGSQQSHTTGGSDPTAASDPDDRFDQDEIVDLTANINLEEGNTRDDGILHL